MMAKKSQLIRKKKMVLKRRMMHKQKKKMKTRKKLKIKLNRRKKKKMINPNQCLSDQLIQHKTLINPQLRNLILTIMLHPISKNLLQILKYSEVSFKSNQKLLQPHSSVPLEINKIKIINNLKRKKIQEADKVQEKAELRNLLKVIFRVYL